MIVRDAEKDLPRCLNSVAGVVDEIVIADTGSTDGTLAVARRYPARVLQIPWENDFALARNRALAGVTADWVLALDADEELDPLAKQHIPLLILQKDIAGYLVTIRNYVYRLQERLWDRAAKPNDSQLESTRAYPAFVEHENVRLFRHDPQIYFVGRVHESVGHKIRENGWNLTKAEFCIHHFGMVAGPAVQTAKKNLYRELGRHKVTEMPGNAQAHFELGMVEFDSFRNLPEALRCFHRASELDPNLAVSWLFAGLSALHLGQHQPALKYLRQAQAHGYQGPLVLEAEGDAQYNLGNFGEAGRLYRRAHKTVVHSAFLESKLALAELRCGHTDTALRRMRRALREENHAPEIHDRMIAALAFAGKLQEAAEAAEAKLAAVDPDESSYLRAASIRTRLRDWQRAEASVAAGLRRFPRSDKLRHALSEIQVLCGRKRPALA